MASLTLTPLQHFFSGPEPLAGRFPKCSGWWESGPAGWDLLWYVNGNVLGEDWKKRHALTHKPSPFSYLQDNNDKVISLVPRSLIVSSSSSHCWKCSEDQAYTSGGGRVTKSPHFGKHFFWPKTKCASLLSRLLLQWWYRGPYPRLKEALSTWTCWLIILILSL